MNKYVEIICVGNELLIGKTLNTNAQWLAKHITTLGLTTLRITIVGDDVNEISSLLKEAIQRNPRFIITTGGLGPTFDDKTLEGIAYALKRRTEVNQDALNMIKEKYFSYMQEGKTKSVELTPYRIKMAKLPQGATPISNPVGTAPAVTIKHKKLTIIALPGVPYELKSIFNESIASQLREIAPGMVFFEKSIHSSKVMESEIAPIIDTVLKNNPHVYIKSHPKGTEKIPHIEFHLSTTAKDNNTAKLHVNKALLQLTELIEEKGGKIDSTQPET